MTTFLFLFTVSAPGIRIRLIKINIAFNVRKLKNRQKQNVSSSIRTIENENEYCDYYENEKNLFSVKTVLMYEKLKLLKL